MSLWQNTIWKLFIFVAKGVKGGKIYIANKYWNNYIGGTDDSLILVEHLAEKQKDKIPLGEILSDFGLDKLHGV